MLKTFSDSNINGGGILALSSKWYLSIRCTGLQRYVPSGNVWPSTICWRWSIFNRIGSFAHCSKTSTDL